MKKREVLIHLESAIISLTKLSIYAAKLEMTDNDTISRQFKQGIVDFENGELAKLKGVSKEIRLEIITKSKARKKIITNNVNQTINQPLKTEEQ